MKPGFHERGNKRVDAEILLVEKGSMNANPLSYIHKHRHLFDGVFGSFASHNLFRNG